MCFDLPGSSAAARKAVHETVFSRIFLQVPVFFFPAIIMSLPGAPTTPSLSHHRDRPPQVDGASTVRLGAVMKNLVRRLPQWELAINTFVLIIGFGFGLPATIAAFPQTGQIRRSDVEQDRFGEVKEETLYYNKGL